MMRSLAIAGLAALIPAMTGPIPAEARQISLALCGGGSLSIPGAPQSPPGNGATPCCAKGCHREENRKRLDRTQ